MNYNFNKDYNQILTQNTGGYLGGGIGTSGGGQDGSLQDNGVGSNWLTALFGALPGTLNGVANLVNGTPTQPNVNVYPTNGVGMVNNSWIWMGLGVVLLLFVVLFVALRSASK